MKQNNCNVVKANPLRIAYLGRRRKLKASCGVLDYS